MRFILPATKPQPGHSSRLSSLVTRCGPRSLFSFETRRKAEVQDHEHQTRY